MCNGLITSSFYPLMYFFEFIFAYDSGLDVNIYVFYLKLLFIITKVFFIDFFVIEIYCFFTHSYMG